MLKNVILALALVGSVADPCAVLDDQDACNRCCNTDIPALSPLINCELERCGWDYENIDCVDVPIPQRKLRFGDIEKPNCCVTLPSNAVCAAD